MGNIRVRNLCRHCAGGNIDVCSTGVERRAEQATAGLCCWWCSYNFAVASSLLGVTLGLFDIWRICLALMTRQWGVLNGAADVCVCAANCPVACCGRTVSVRHWLCRFASATIWAAIVPALLARKSRGTVSAAQNFASGR